MPVGKRRTGPAPQVIPLAVGCFGEKKKLWLMSPSPNCEPAPRENVLLVDHRNNRSREQVPLVVQMKRDHRLHIGLHPGPVVERAEVEIEVGLDRHGDEIGHRVGEILSQIGGISPTLFGHDRLYVLSHGRRN